MSKWICLLLWIMAGLVISACQEEEVPVYMDQDRVNFVGTSEDDENDPDYMYVEKNFLTEKGKSCEYLLRVKVQGRAMDWEREVYFTVRDSTTPGVKMEFGECVIPAGKLRGECRVTIMRPTGDDELISLIGIDYERSDFGRGTFERQEFMLKVKDQISYEILNINENSWNNGCWMMGYLLGPWSFTKARFICQTLGITDFYAWYHDPAHWDSWDVVCFDQEKLVEALEEYKANPENPPLYDETLLPEKVWISFVTEE